MAELRLNLIAKEWVIVHTERAKKPEDFRQRKDKKYRPQFSEACPFCQGNESKTPADLIKIPAEGQWKIRVIPNKFSTLMYDGERKRENVGLRHTVTGVGRHEVIIETPRHDLSLALLSVSDVKDILNVYLQRFVECFKDNRVQHVIIFKNHGLQSGTSIMHPHSQVIGTPVVPVQVRNRIDESVRYFDHTGECLLCATLKDELSDGKRVIVDSKHFASFIPFAALSPFHTWIFPKRHMQSFAHTNEEELIDLAYTLQTTLAKLYHGLDDPDYNLVIRSLSPFRSRSEYIHWYMSIVPNVINSTGFQLGTGMHVNTAIPEDVAEFLRNVKVP